MATSIRSFNGGSSLTLIEDAFSQVPGLLSLEKGFVAAGDDIEIEEQEGFLRGHGTYLVDNKLKATICGVVERVNKLVYVRPLKTRYTAEQGDVVIGRVTEVAGKRWKVNLKSRQEAGLLLSAVNLPGGMQRRRNAEDELNMRTLFKEGDLISAEVQQVMSEGGVALHTRSSKYGKLVAGHLLTIPASLVKRQKQHFVSMQTLGVDIILGCNGLIWVSPTSPAGEASNVPAAAVVAEEGFERCKALSRLQVEVTARVANCIRALASLFLPIYPATILDAYEIALEHSIPVKQILEDDFLSKLIESQVLRRSNELRT
ncbi:hypothetical protein CEUSTIGMA_g5280.t1 [Chlamydomonas eustigma]|uniref:S1 motif domain-containing protein n=1 Tax=Chlamydomonas eustigma TaxID=1157962 RepID=A0A250X433_9CHLO|nr:hypothetical protein CEUSTIGMA_g5280.t1 [Chlamydomonas eustigma]|eukprot:GAX77838.1 hypothetical protein CEUSTIGMA_g5280.t1 [Chlamydomonas eustigma]